MNSTSLTGDAAQLRSAFLATGSLEDHVRFVFERLMSEVRPTPNRPDFKGAEAICPVQPNGEQTDEPLGLILETRRHRNLPFVIRQVVRRCGIPVQIMHGPGNRNFVYRQLADLISEGRVIPTALASDRLTGKIYNGLLLSPTFWNAIAGRGKILVFQTDSMLCRRSAYRFEDFLDFDYIGSWRPPGHGCGLIYGGGNGGFSLRDWDHSVRVLDLFDACRWPAGEDDFFSLFLDVIGARVANGEDSDRFCGQRSFHRGCFGLHKPNFRNLRLAATVLAYEPRAWRLVTPIEKRLARG